MLASSRSSRWAARLPDLATQIEYMPRPETVEQELAVQKSLNERLQTQLRVASGQLYSQQGQIGFSILLAALLGLQIIAYFLA